MKIAIDFDGTCVEHAFPYVGKDVPGAVASLKWLVSQGHELTLFTMRSQSYLSDAIAWFERNEIELTGIQYERSQTSWTQSNKCYAEVYIDDAALGAPLIYPDDRRPYYDWVTGMMMLKKIIANEADRNPVVGVEL